jgi:hypothetical protein
MIDNNIHNISDFHQQSAPSSSESTEEIDQSTLMTTPALLAEE